MKNVCCSRGQAPLRYVPPEEHGPRTGCRPAAVDRLTIAATSLVVPSPVSRVARGFFVETGVGAAPDETATVVDFTLSTSRALRGLRYRAS